mgnify:CR=1 FL=1|jgi:threonine dehydratase
MSTAELNLPDLAAIRAARSRIASRVPATPTVAAHDLGESLGQPLYLKAENLQVTGSFKARGATNWLRMTDPAQRRRGLITVSAGNHALALAWAARHENIPVTVVMPKGSSPAKIEGTRRFGAEVIVRGDIREAVAHCHRLRESRGLSLVHPYDDPMVMAGQGTVGLEILEQVPNVERILCPVGGGGLISGIGLAVKALKPDVTLIGIEPDGAATLGNAWAHNDPGAALPAVNTIAASLAPVTAGRYTYAASRRVVDAMVTVPDSAIVEATRLLLTRGRLYGETGATVAIAALLSGAVPVVPEITTLAVITGGNMDISQCCDLLVS